MAGFMDNFGSMLQNPQFLMGMGLLNNQKSANPMQDAMMNMLQFQQMQRAFAPQQGQMQAPMQQPMPPPQMGGQMPAPQMPPPQMGGQMPQIQGMGGGMGMRPPRGMGGFGGKMKSGLFG